MTLFKREFAPASKDVVVSRCENAQVFPVVRHRLPNPLNGFFEVVVVLLGKNNYGLFIRDFLGKNVSFNYVIFWLKYFSLITVICWVKTVLFSN